MTRSHSDSPPHPETDYDVLVLGGGIVGAAAAHALARGRSEGREGKGAARPPRRTLLVDAFDPAHDRGSSHGDGRIVRFTYAEAVYLEMARHTYPLWAEIEEHSGVRLLERTGSWECGPADSPVLAELAAGLAGAGIAFDDLDAAESRRRFPHFDPPAGGRVLYQADGAIVRAGLAVETLWRLAAEAGAELRPRTRVVALEPDADGVTVELESPASIESPANPESPTNPKFPTNRARLRVDHLVIAAGGWARSLLASLDLELPIEPCREVVAYFPEKAGSGVDHGFGSMPTLIDYCGTEPFYALPRIEIPGVKVGWHHAGPPTDPDEDGEADPRILDGLRRFVAERFPHLLPEPTKQVTCLYANTPDYHFVLDTHPHYPRVVIGAGFSGHGFKFGPILGELLADLASEREPAVDLAPFRTSRFGQEPVRRRGA